MSPPIDVSVSQTVKVGGRVLAARHISDYPAFNCSDIQPYTDFD